MVDAFRAFVAVEVGALPGAVSLLDGLRATDADLKVVPPENLHVTLKFIGQLAEDRVGDVVGAMRDAVRTVEPFTMRLEGVGTFGPKNAPRVVWVGIHDGGRLGPVAARLDERLDAMGVAAAERRAFKPHLTLARSRSPRGGERVATFATAHAHADGGSVRVDHVVLMRSRLSPQGPAYEPVERVPLGGDGGA